MIRLPSLALAAAIALLAANHPAAADHSGDYANAWLGERLRHDRPNAYWTDLISRPAKRAEPPSGGPRTWEPHDQNPWANAYGTPAGNGWRSTGARPSFSGPVRMCACFLPADARSWDGGPLTEADVVRLCRAQCY